MSDAEKYIKKLASTVDKSKVLVDNGTGAKLDCTSTVDTTDNLIVIKREKESAQNNTGDITNINANLTGVYPGSIVHADSHLVDGQPNIVAGEGLVRKPIKVWLDVNRNTEDSTVVEEPTQSGVMQAVNTMIDNWLAKGKTSAAQIQFKTISVYNSEQLDVELGVKGAGDKFGIDFKATSSGKEKVVLVFAKQIYYSARVEPCTASALYADSVNEEILRNGSVDEKNPLAAMVTSVDFGRLIVIKLSTKNTSLDIETAAKATFDENEVKTNDKYKQILDNSECNVFVFGGKESTAASLIKEKEIKKIIEIISGDTIYTQDSAACPLSYSTCFIDDGSRATVSRSTEYVKTTVTKRDRIHIKTDTAYGYITKHQKLWGKAVTGIEADGHFVLGDWDCLMDAGNGNQERYISGKYAELGFEFDITGGTDWPYTGVFWTADQGAAEEVFIDMGGGCRTASIKISVNGKQIFRDGNCDSHKSMFGS